MTREARLAFTLTVSAGQLCEQACGDFDQVTFTLDDATVLALRRSAERLGRPQSAIVREAIADYAERIGRLSTHEQTHMLQVIDTFMSQPVLASVTAVDAELHELRQSRRAAARDQRSRHRRR